MIATLAIAMLMAVPTPDPAPTVTYVADCDGITITTAGWADEGYSGQLGLQGAPPWIIPANTARHYPVYNVVGGYQWTIYVTAADQPTHAESGVVFCGEPAPPAEDVPVDAAPMNASIPEPPVGVDSQSVADPAPAVRLWANVELAPPW